MLSWRQRVRNLEAIAHDQQNLIQNQQKLIEEQRELIQDLTRRLNAYENPHTPSSKQRKKNTEHDESKPRFPGKPKGGNGGGIELPPPDKVEEHTLDACPDCDGKLQMKSMRKHTVIDLPEKPIETVEHRILQYYCNRCKKHVEPVTHLPDGFYGTRLQSMVIMLKNLTNSHEKIASLMRELGAPSFSAAQVQHIADVFIERLQPIRNTYLGMLRNADYVNADETGFRKDGRNGYVWGVFTRSIAIFSAQMSRARLHIEKILPLYEGVVVSDGYNAYDDFEMHQRCWAHLLREAKEYTDNDEINVQYKRLKMLYEHLKMLKAELPDERKNAAAKEQLNDIVTCLNTIQEGRKLATLITNGGDDWFTALYYKNVPLDNNHAERELRSVVLLRKTIGCYRNQKGKGWIDVVMSVIHTWKLQGLNVFKQLCALD